jgi:hypothetical protein
MGVGLTTLCSVQTSLARVARGHVPPLRAASCFQTPFRYAQGILDSALKRHHPSPDERDWGDGGGGGIDYVTLRPCRMRCAVEMNVLRFAKLGSQTLLPAARDSPPNP